MSDYVTGALITGGFALLLFLLGRWLGGARKDAAETEATIAGEWKDWAAELKARVAALEEDVAELKQSLEFEQAKNQRQSQLMRSVIRWALLLRDEVLRSGGDVPPAPPEVEAALTNLEP